MACRHEGHGSILANLKERGWATSLSAGEGSGSFSGRSFFNVRVTLTDEGVSLSNSITIQTLVKGCNALGRRFSTGR